MFNNTSNQPAHYDNIYVETLKHNNNTIPILAKFSETRTAPYLHGPISDYYLTIVNAYIPAQNLPLFEFKNNEYKITMSYNGTDEQKFVNFIQFNTGPEQYVYTYYEFIDMINQTFTDVYNDLVLSAGPLPTSSPPKIYLLEGNQGFAIQFDQEYSTDVVPNTVQVYFNSALWSFFETFYGKFNGYNLPSGKDFLFIVKNQVNNVDSTNNKFINKQSNEAFYLLLDIRSIVITSDAMPVKSSYLALSQNLIGRGNSEIAILTSINPDWSAFSSINKEPIIYSPQPQYRLIDMVDTNASLTKLSYQFFWQNRFGELKPLYIPPNDHISMKFLFIKKK